MKNWKDELAAKKEILEDILNSFEKYGVTDQRAKAIIEGKLDGIKRVLGDE